LVWCRSSATRLVYYNCDDLSSIILKKIKKNFYYEPKESNSGGKADFSTELKSSEFYKNRLIQCLFIAKKHHYFTRPINNPPKTTIKKQAFGINVHKNLKFVDFSAVINYHIGRLC
jgi:hypothetical protein